MVHRAVELSTLFVGTAAFSTLALILDLTASPDMVVRSALTYMLLVYAISRATCSAALLFIDKRPRSGSMIRRPGMRSEKCVRISSLPKFSLHDLRRAWASALHANGASIKQISVWLGHSSIQVTERYIRSFEPESTGHEFLPC
jgi:integrase